MAKLIRKAAVKEVVFNVGDQIHFFRFWNDGRMGYNDKIEYYSIRKIK